MKTIKWLILPFLLTGMIACQEDEGILKNEDLHKRTDFQCRDFASIQPVDAIRIISIKEN